MFASHAIRNLDLSSEEVKPLMGADPDGYLLIRHKSTNLPPAILRTSQESRNEALKYYELCFGSEITEGDIHININDKIYFNANSDRICFAVRNPEHEAYSGSWMRDELGDNHVKRIAINIAEGTLSDDHPTRRSKYYDAFVRNPKNWIDGGIEEIIIYHFDNGLEEDLPRDFEFVNTDLEQENEDIRRRLADFKQAFDKCIIDMTIEQEENDIRAKLLQDNDKFEVYQKKYGEYGTRQNWLRDKKEWSTKWTRPSVTFTKVKEIQKPPVQ